MTVKAPDGFSKGGLRVAGPGDNGIRRLGDLIGPALDRAKRRQTGEEQPVQTPWDPLNRTLGGGFWPGAHFLVAGTGVGKSALTFQVALHAAKANVPCGLIALELDEMSLAIRIACDEAGVTWSKVYNGAASDDELARVRAVAARVGALPIHADFGQAMGWSSQRLELMAKQLRATHPKGPLCIVLDFVQLVSGDPDDKRTPDLRERIGRAGYRARNLANTYGACVIVVSSVARNNYAALSNRLDKAGLVLRNYGGTTRRAVLDTDSLIGLGKESGELEYAADSLNVLMRPVLKQGCYDNAVAEMMAQGGRIVVCVTAKMRAGAPSWFALNFHQGRFLPINEDSINSLAREPEQSDEEKEQSDSQTIDKMVAAIAGRIEPFMSKRDLAKAVGGRKSEVMALIDTAIEQGFISGTKDKQGRWTGPFAVVEAM